MVHILVDRLRGDDRTQKPYKKSGQIEIYKVEIESNVFQTICKKLKVNRIGNKEINELLDIIEEYENHECTTPDEPPHDRNDLD